MSHDRLLAKSRKRDEAWHDSMLLPVHLEDVYRAAEAVLDATAIDQLRAVGLPVEVYLDRFRRIVVLAAALHDLGKANNHFQAMLRAPGTLQGLRHEWATVLMADRSEWRLWLRPAVVEDVDLELVLWAIGGHHPAYGRTSPPQRNEHASGSALHLLMGHDDFTDALSRIAGLLSLDKPPVCGDETVSLNEAAMGSAFPQLGRWLKRAAQMWGKRDEGLVRLAAVVKACLIAADVAGSALPRAGKSRSWISEAFSRVPSQADLQQIVADRLEGKALRPFQLEVATQTNRVVLARAGCGSGKTLAAYEWAARQCPSRRIYFCYPTTGTATEGYRGYLFNEEAKKGKFGAQLFHGRAEVDLDIILNVAGDDDPDGTDAIDRFRSLDAWSTPLVSCTVDTVLGMMQNHRKGLYAWPALAQSAFVFDEIHAFDERLFAALLRFLKDVRGVRVLLMTASLPEPRLQALRDGLRGQGETLVEVAGPVELEGLKRYRRLVPCDPRDPLAEVQEAIVKDNGKVLWVCNLVDRAIQAAARAEAVGLNPLVYHSRFRYEDRVGRHRAVMEAFEGDGPALAICTQVAEMSLDLSATLLVTDLAPVPSMIQRLGRLNRRAVPNPSGEDPPAMPFIVVEPQKSGGFTPLPYDTSATAYGDWPAASRGWLGKIGDKAVSQADLACAWESSAGGGKARPGQSEWLDGGPETSVAELREGAPGLTVVLTSDHTDLKTGKTRLVEAALPMPIPRSLPWRSWPVFKSAPVVPDDAIDYDYQRGASWRK